MRLGEFLVSKHLVTEEEITKALEVQRHSKTMLGKLAVEHGMLGKLDNIHIILAQRNTGKSYGQLAKEKNLLREEQIRELLDLQEATRMPLGKVLVEETALSRYQLVMALREYVRQFKVTP